MGKGRATIYTKDGCPWCIRAKGLLEMAGYEISEIDLNDATSREAFYVRSQTNTLPQVVINDQFVVGFRDLQERLVS